MVKVASSLPSYGGNIDFKEILQVCINEILLKSNGYCKFYDHKMMYLAARKMVKGMRKLIPFFDVEGVFQQLEEDLWRA